MFKTLQTLLTVAILLLFVLLPGFPVSAQTKLVLNGGIINIQERAALVVTNPSADAISRTGGHIISEGENNELVWHIGETNGYYTIPWGVGSNQYIPFSFKKSGGTGSGVYTFSTYSTGGQISSSLPGPITQLQKDGTDMTPVVLDRFWQVSTQNYTTAPLATNVTFSYLKDEFSGQNSKIVEDNLQAYRWNEDLNKWEDQFFDADVDPATNTLSINSVSGEQMYSWWFLADNITPLPVELLYISATAEGEAVNVRWATASEQNSDYFTVERSSDGVLFEPVATVKGAGFSNELNTYQVMDKNPLQGISYYRLKQADLDGQVNYSKIQSVAFSGNALPGFVVFPNPSKHRFFIQTTEDGGEFDIALFDLIGSKQPVELTAITPVLTEVVLSPVVKPGAYLLQV
ncbi:MAG: T9SS type A sorting domain-containing protein, partial [Hymenobacteraceae bacterium]|nr:T9SS type A sorting domain-containing protein [Hymenobacteraceae bacterium]MDX5395096.1 T9SS type A sorting domain-containing protein [Hymenobacteraceae bacterium]MDX5443357.1 T9SS type A sorting domain-containing protein [Hymenobacteraceae bacterium]MDX5511134.1 T9SS type A sorting domain-containing protein [Hymenobacteraceae bacterium]